MCSCSTCCGCCMIWTLDNNPSIWEIPSSPMYMQHTWKPYLIVKCPAAILIKILGTNIGDTLRWPLKIIIRYQFQDDLFLHHLPLYQRIRMSTRYLQSFPFLIQYIHPLEGYEHTLLYQISMMLTVRSLPIASFGFHSASSNA